VGADLQDVAAAYVKIRVVLRIFPGVVSESMRKFTQDT
jgi:hypothetical protein